MPKYRMKRHAVTQPLDTSYKIIPLTREQNAIVDSADYDWLNKWNLYAKWNSYTKSWYAVRKNGFGVYMAREILKCKSGEEADHRNHNTLDNRRDNLRKATDSQNTSNRRMQSNNTSGYVGVFFNKKLNKWQASVSLKRKTIYVGIFDSIKEAAQARDKVANRLYGEFAHLNFPLNT